MKHLHYYLSSKFTVTDPDGKVQFENDSDIMPFYRKVVDKIAESEREGYTFKPHLRSMDSLTDAEKIELYDIETNNAYKGLSKKIKISKAENYIKSEMFTAKSFAYLIQLEIDIFNQIGENKAILKTEI